MDIDVPSQDYFAKAERAEAYARQSSDLVTRKTWLRIAEGYRHLAEFVRARSARGFAWGSGPGSADARTKYS